jgi:hypothetical protein
MPGLLDLPDLALKNVIGEVLDLPKRPEPIRSIPQGTITYYPNSTIEMSALPLLLCCRRVSKLTNQTAFLRAVFQVTSIEALARFVNNVGAEQLQLLR